MQRPEARTASLVFCLGGSGIVGAVVAGGAALTYADITPASAPYVWSGLLTWAMGGWVVGLLAGAAPALLSWWASFALRPALTVTTVVMSAAVMCTVVWLPLSAGFLRPVGSVVFWSASVVATAVAARAWWQVSRPDFGSVHHA